MQNKVVAHSSDGILIKGITNDFFPNKDRFHVAEDGTGELREVVLAEQKAVFFVKDYAGNSEYEDRTDVERIGFGKKVRVDFVDGEKLVGYCSGYLPNRPGVFVFPSDPDSNNDRVYVVAASALQVQFV
jgi:hypothetical protein